MKTRLTSLFNLSSPIVLAPMAMTSGADLALACARAGALGLIGGGYADLQWTRQEYQRAQASCRDDPAGEQLRSRLGIGFITWRLDRDASALDWVLDQPSSTLPRAVMLSFGDPQPYAARIAARGIPLICQIQRMGQLARAMETGAGVIVAQGGEAGGHGLNSLDARATMTLVPEVADWLAQHAPETLLLAAGGIADGRTLAAALALGADGALMGSRFWATRESLADPAAKHVALAALGDDTARSPVFDILRDIAWPAPYDFRAIRNDLHRQWELRLQALREQPDSARANYRAGVAAADFSRAHVTVGEAVGLLHDLPPASELIARISEETRLRLKRLAHEL